ncbi:MAG: hypothetical protein GY811_25665 [Myxococcales bacterium]|nr:hypothetical protein [Myxococcales bacterium]
MHRAYGFIMDPWIQTWDRPLQREMISDQGLQEVNPADGPDDEIWMDSEDWSFDEIKG